MSTSTLADSASHVSDVLIVEQPGSASSIDLSLADLEAITVNGYLAALSRLADQRARACVITRSCIAQSGADGIKTLRQTDAKMPVLLLDDSDDAIPFALRAGFDDVLEPWRASTQLAEAAARRDWDRDGRHAVVLCSADTAFRRRTAETLELAGFLVLPVAGPWEALARLRERPVDVLITDLIMPELDGCELIEAARRYSPSVGCLAVAALSTSDDSPQTPDSEILHRPIDPLQLVAATRRSLAPEPVPEEPDALAGPRPSVLVLAPDWARARGVLQQLSESVETRFDVTWSARPSEVAARLARGEADAVIVDLDSSDAEGAEMCARLRVDADGVPIIALTGDKDTRAADKARACGAVISLSHSRIGQLASRLSLLLGGRDTSPDLPASLALEDSSEAVVLVDKERTIRFANRAAESLLGQELAGRPFPHPVAPHLETDFEVLVSGEIRTVEMRVRPARAAGGELVISLRDATQQRKNERRLRALSDQLREANRQIEALAYTDPLTRLPNRRGLERRLLSEAARARRSGSDLMALLVDCDSFKAVNDGHGHDVGDAVLVHVADAVVDAVRPTDLVSRVGGDEFLVLLPATREAEAVQVAERVRGGIADTAVEVGGLTVPMTVSLGVSRVPAETQSIQEVLAACHAALERSKGAGKNRVSFGSTHDPRLHLAEPADEESRLVDESFYSAVLQPIRQLKTGQILGFEALVRARDAALARPTELFRAARMHRLQTAVDLRSLKAGALVAAETTGTVHLNLLPGTLLETPTEQILELLPSSLRGRVVLELSEQQLVGDPSKLCEPMKHLREAGVRFALDDVGFGKSSLEALIVLEPEVVKLARRCVTGVANRTDGRRTLSRLVKVIRALGAEIIAVGVESRRDVEVLLELDVSSAQGFLWDPPEDPPAL